MLEKVNDPCLFVCAVAQVAIAHADGFKQEYCAGNLLDDTSSDEDPEDSQDDKKIINRDILKHKEQLQALRSQDPEFYEYLEQADQKLLDFGDEDEDSEVCNLIE